MEPPVHPNIYCKVGVLVDQRRTRTPSSFRSTSSSMTSNALNNLSLDDDPHAALVHSLTTLYALLTDLQYLPSSHIRPPPHPPTDFDTTAAAEAGFMNVEALALLGRIPYIVGEGTTFPLAPETEPLCYTNTQEDSSASEEAFDFARDPTQQDETDLMPDGVINLTRAKNGGTSLIYDVEKKTITAWNHFNDEVERWQENRAYGMQEEGNPLYIWIRNWLSLVWVPQVINGWPNVISMEGPPVTDEPDEETRALKQLHVDSGWDTSTINEGGSGGIPARLERARPRAKRGLRVDELQRRREEWQERWQS